MAVRELGALPWERAVSRWLAAGAHYREETKRALVGFACVYCGDPAETVDHVVPRAAGGSDDVSNLVPACRSCNGSKGAQSLDVWLDRLNHYVMGARRAERRVKYIRALAPIPVVPPDPFSDEFDSPDFLDAWDRLDQQREENR